MLSSVLGSDTAVEMNIRIMRVFTAAHQIMENNAILFIKTEGRFWSEPHSLDRLNIIAHLELSPVLYWAHSI